MAITREQALQELSRRGKDVSSFVPSASSMPKFPSISKQSALEELKRRGKDVSHLEENSLLNKASGLGKGFVAGLGGGALDTAALIYNLPAMLHNLSVKGAKDIPPETLSALGLGEYAQVAGAASPGEVPMIPSATEAIEKGIEENLGIETPEDMEGLYEGAKFAGSLGGLGGLGSVASKAGMKGLGKVASAVGTTAPAELAAAVPTGAVIHNIGEEYGPVIGLGAGALTGAAATKGLRTIGKATQGLKGTLTGKGETLGEMTIGKAISHLGHHSERVERLAKEYNLDLPFNIRLQGPWANFMANNFMNSLFSAKDWKYKITNTPKNIIKSVTDKIDEIYPGNIGKRESSKAYLTAFKDIKSGIKEEEKRLYDYRDELLKDNDYVPIEKNDDFVKKLLDLTKRYDVWSPDEKTKAVVRKINELGEGLNILPKYTKNQKQDYEKFLEDPINLEKVVTAFIKGGVKVPVKKFANQKSSLMRSIDWDETGGPNDALKGLINPMEKIIEKMGNKEALNAHKAANSFHKNEIADRIRTDTAMAITQVKQPELAYNYMNSPEDIKELHHIIGNSSQANQIMNSLKRAKLQDVLIDPITNTDKSARFANWANLFEKGNEKQELLKSLLGKERYEDIKNFSKIGEEFYSAGKSFSNFSGTTLTARDYITLSTIPTAAVTGNLPALGIAISAAASPWIMSKLLTNKRYTDAAVKYARARKEGGNGSPYQNTMKRIFLETAKKASPHIAKKQIETQE